MSRQIQSPQRHLVHRHTELMMICDTEHATLNTLHMYIINQNLFHITAQKLKNFTCFRTKMSTYKFVYKHEIYGRCAKIKPCSGPDNFCILYYTDLHSAIDLVQVGDRFCHLHRSKYRRDFCRCSKRWSIGLKDMRKYGFDIELNSLYLCS